MEIFFRMFSDRFPGVLDEADFIILTSPESKAIHPALGLSMKGAGARIRSRKSGRGKTR